MSEEKENIQQEQQQTEKELSQNDFQQQQQQQLPVQNIPTPSQAECMAYVKFARYTALAADRLAEALLQMTAKLEDEGILKCGRSSRINRDKKLRLYAINIQKTNTEINDMMKLIPSHPDSEKLISSLFKGIKNFPSNIGGLNNLSEENPILIPDAMNDIFQINAINKETENNQTQGTTIQTTQPEMPQSSEILEPEADKNNGKSVSDPNDSKEAYNSNDDSIQK
ncbi:hypothetical protein M9Y10_005462 [Tritrichomonas musculus]|uniref:Uncharacterized protein n=1 Tax=Tritrichomonas musculus TaxID=1915356 RepID=A0ABR2JL89_9EUKA